MEYYDLMLRVKNCIERTPKAVTPRSTLREAVVIMLSENVDGVAVVDDAHRILGVLTLGYLLRGFTPEHLMELSEPMLSELEQVDIHAFFGPTERLFLVADFFKQDVKPLSPEMPLLVASHEITRQGLSFLPVVEKNRLVGVLTQRDIMRAFFNRTS